jgi:transcription initiation factor IIF auxiliary subunit
MEAAVPQNVMAQRQSEAPCKFELVVNNLHEETPNSANKSKWSMWVALRGLANKQTAAIIEKVIYEVDSTCKENSVTTYPPFFSLCRHDSAPSVVRCRIHWAPILGIRPTNVDHHLMLEKSGNRSTHAIDVDRDALYTLELEVLKRVPSSITQLQLSKEGIAKLSGVDPVFLNALGLDVSQRRAERPMCWVPPQTCTSKDVSLLEVVVGNRYRAVDVGEPCIWTMYVMLPGFQLNKSTMIKQVIYNLHPAFSPDTYTLNSPNFDLTCVGWGTFKVTCTIHWHRSLGLQPTTLVHELVSDELGGRTSATISVSSRRMQFFA